ncbi:MAG: hypothetical protein ACOCRX_04610, partial [Candidatus Woesearchaeota archaeon]
KQIEYEDNKGNIDKELHKSTLEAVRELVTLVKETIMPNKDKDQDKFVKVNMARRHTGIIVVKGKNTEDVIEKVNNFGLGAHYRGYGEAMELEPAPSSLKAEEIYEIIEEEAEEYSLIYS